MAAGQLSGGVGERRDCVGQTHHWDCLPTLYYRDMHTSCGLKVPDTKSPTSPKPGFKTRVVLRASLDKRSHWQIGHLDLP